MTKVVSVAGGKGGTGKTVFASSLATALSNLGKVLAVDADVDNPCLHTLLTPSKKRVEELKAFRPRINASKCRACHACVAACPEHALLAVPNKPPVLAEEACAGCRVCYLVCRYGAVEEEYVSEGKIVFGEVSNNLHLIYGEVLPGTRRSYVIARKLMMRVRTMLESYNFVVVDSPCGTGAGVYAALEPADLVIAVTEPTPHALLDLEKFLKLSIDTLGKKVIVIVNKFVRENDVYRKLVDIAKSRNLEVLTVPYDEEVVAGYSRCRVPIGTSIWRVAESIASRIASSKP